MKNKTLAGILILAGLLLPRVAGAVEFKLLEQHGIPFPYSAKTSQTSSHSVVGIGLNWAIITDGGGADFRLWYSTGAGSNFTVVTSSTFYTTDGAAINNTFGAIIYNPSISIDRIDAATTAYIDILYLQKKDGAY